MKPDAYRCWNPSPTYLRQLIAKAGLTQSQAAAAIGCSPRAMRSYLSTDPASHQDASYPVQFTLEALAGVAPKALRK